MASLPKKRLDIYDKPFASTGVDYFEPFLVKHSKRPNKASNFSNRERYQMAI